MKAQRFFIIALLMIVSLAALILGCKYDVAEPQWDKPNGTTTAATISSVEPAQAAPGVNTITIRGTNFTGAIDTSVVHNEYVDTTYTYNGVYFDNLQAEVIEYSSTSIKVRRPNLVSDFCTVKVVPSRASVVARFGPYKISSVVERYGSFLDNVALSVVAVDNTENLYVVITGSRSIYKVTPAGQKTLLGGVATRAPTDARVGPDGRLYMTGNNRSIDVVDPSTGQVKTWTQLPSGRVVKFGDFDATGYFYTGGTRSQLVVVAPNLTATSTGLYAADDILGVRVYNGYLYLAVKAAAGQTPSLAIWRHSIGANGTLGAKQLVLNLDATEFASRAIRAFSFSTSGILYIGTDSPNPILIVDPTTLNMDILYKGILAPYCKQFCWGKANYLYMISGNTSPAQEWIVYRVDMGITSGQ